MSVIIPNMNMPMSCLACPLAREMFGCLVCVGYFKDNLTGRRVYKSDLKESDKDFNRPDWCPLVPLPEGHGGLCDRDALIKELQNLFDKREKDAAFSGNRGPSVTWNDAICSIFAAPIIVPAEGGGEDGWTPEEEEE